MLWVTCPNCGDRPVEEYRFGGELPTVPDHVTDPDERDLDYVWFFDNVKGPSTERWFHHAGCRRWLTLHRDTTNDHVLLAD
jgi:sarcosine oxidase, subunit delta